MATLWKTCPPVRSLSTPNSVSAHSDPGILTTRTLTACATAVTKKAAVSGRAARLLQVEARAENQEPAALRAVGFSRLRGGTDVSKKQCRWPAWPRLAWRGCLAHRKTPVLQSVPQAFLNGGTEIYRGSHVIGFRIAQDKQRFRALWLTCCFASDAPRIQQRTRDEPRYRCQKTFLLRRKHSGTLAFGAPDGLSGSSRWPAPRLAQKGCLCKGVLVLNAMV
jgi:hypothetical protein